MSNVKVDEALPKTPADERDWAELHPDILMAIFDKLGMLQVLLRAIKVCRSWRMAARDDLLFWRKIDMEMMDEDSRKIPFDWQKFKIISNIDLENMTKIAANWGGNNVHHLSTGNFCHGDLLKYIIDRTRNLKSLKITARLRFDDVAMALGRLKQLEELEIIQLFPVRSGFMMEALGSECPQLKRLKLNISGFFGTSTDEGIEPMLGIPKTMLQLKYLQLTGTCTTNEELMKILERCPNLEMLELCGSTEITVKDNDLKARCPKIHIRLLPDDDTDDESYDTISVGSHELDTNDYSSCDTDDDVYDDFYDDPYVDIYDYTDFYLKKK
ncbi:F-box protein SKIP19 [Rhynchospora pubera]|uniref:F-box protein SKIP19 n=1 Tax=Rhynchospora pubera TaxID=906938 RepID=A0AAV8EW75_9POAL|nr:F-box protein SKIP19 [Rhynchospora pubera]